ncbi:MAG: hypothetical protein MOIL_00700 [Candidatus Methanolliviera sp. GoM_oil]|nr:MAG: hypothetical protein MOIL_00700 [Candidatus Methanolliviera sp. GoM_oil]
MMKEALKNVIRRIEEFGIEAHFEEGIGAGKIEYELWDDTVTDVFCILNFHPSKKEVDVLLFPTINIDPSKVMNVLKDELTGWEIKYR